MPPSYGRRATAGGVERLPVDNRRACGQLARQEATLAGVVVPPVDDEGFAVDSFFEPESAVDLSEDLLSDEEDEVVAAASAVVEEARLSVR
jgi:hypothetical protein